MERISWKPFTAEWRKKQVESGKTRITTFRKGEKWLRPDLVGQFVALFDEGAQIEFAVGRVVKVALAEFRDLDHCDWAGQTSEMAGEKSLEVMRSVYGEYDMATLTCVVTIEVGP